MSGVLGIILAVVALLAVFAWVIVAIAVVQILILAPKGQKMTVYGKLGWWNMADIRTIVGPAADPHIRAMKRAGIAFIVCAAIGVGLGVVAGAMSPK